MTPLDAGSTGDRLVVMAPEGLAVLDPRTGAFEGIVEGRPCHAIVGRRTRRVFYMRGAAVQSTHLDTGVTRAIAELPGDMTDGSGFAVNADETLLVGAQVERGCSRRRSGWTTCSARPPIRA